MVRSILIGTTLVAATALVSWAHEATVETGEKRDYRSQIADTGGHQGREYVQNGVLVIEGAPRWTEYRYSSTTRRLPAVVEPFVRIFD